MSAPLPVVLDGLAVTLPARAACRGSPRLGFVDEVYPSIRYTATLNRSPAIIGADEFENTTGVRRRRDQDRRRRHGVDPQEPVPRAGRLHVPGRLPEGRPRVLTTPKVIVARAFPGPGAGKAGRCARPAESFHGTHVAGIAAGDAGTMRRPAGTTRPSPGSRGVAPRACLGNYRVFTVPTPIGHVANTPEIVAAFEAAVADGMDVINFSGGGPQTEPASDALVEAVSNVAAAGVVPVIAAGNDRDDYGLGSVGSPGHARRMRSRSRPSRTHTSSPPALSVPGGAAALQRIPFAGAAGSDAPSAWATVDQTLVDLGSIVGTRRQARRPQPLRPAADPNGSKTNLPAGSLKGRVVLAIARHVHLHLQGDARHAQPARPGSCSSTTAAARRTRSRWQLPLAAGMVSDLDGQRLRAALTAAGGRRRSASRARSRRSWPAAAASSRASRPPARPPSGTS